MSAQIAVSHSGDPTACASELKAKVAGIRPAFLLFFATPALDPDALAASLQREFGDVPSLGCTTAGELASGRMLDHSVVLLALGQDSVKHASVQVVSDVGDDSAIQRGVMALGEDAGTPAASLNPERYVGLVLHDGLAAAEERVMAHVSQLTNVPFVGGSAGDGLRFERTVVFANFRPCSGASALALLEPTRPYRILKTQSFKVLDHVLTATVVDEPKRTVKSFDGKPATREYAQRLGVSLQDLPAYFRRHPVGIVMDNGEPFVRCPQRANGDDVLFYCQIAEGSRVHLLEAGDLIEDTRRDLASALERFPRPQAIINFDCVERRQELKRIGKCQEYGALFEGLPAIGFSTYGESYIGHMNQTATMLLIA